MRDEEGEPLTAAGFHMHLETLASQQADEVHQLTSGCWMMLRSHLIGSAEPLQVQMGSLLLPYHSESHKILLLGPRDLSATGCDII